MYRKDDYTDVEVNFQRLWLLDQCDQVHVRVIF